MRQPLDQQRCFDPCFSFFECFSCRRPQNDLQADFECPARQRIRHLGLLSILCEQALEASSRSQGIHLPAISHLSYSSCLSSSIWPPHLQSHMPHSQHSWLSPDSPSPPPSAPKPSATYTSSCCHLSALLDQSHHLNYSYSYFSFPFLKSFINFKLIKILIMFRLKLTSSFRRR